MKRSPDNQINASFIDILRITWLVFYCGRLSSTQLVLLQAPKQQPIIDRTRSNRQHTGETSKTIDINPSLQIRGWYVKGTGCG